MDSWQDRLIQQWGVWRERWALADHAAVLFSLFLLCLLLQLAFGWYWSREPESFAVAASDSGHAPPGVVLAETLARVSGTLLDKRGGYLRNDMLPPGLFLDNIPAWELGVLHQVRDMTRALHRDMSLSHAQFIEDADLAVAETAFNANADSWVLPAAEGEFRRGSESVAAYGRRLAAGKDARFYPRAIYLQHWLGDATANLGRLSARLNAALPDTPTVVVGEGVRVLPRLEETSWWQVDDVFYEARGSAWALLHLLKAVEVDFGPELARQQAGLSLRAAIHELEATQQAVWSPVILNGSGFGLFANHSLVMANYLNRAQTDLADVEGLLQAPR
ncbi:MAG: DUF2333 family protein [bacterium]|nr:DUF2333 family protein [bacterium]